MPGGRGNEDRETDLDINFRANMVKFMVEKELSYRELERLTGIGFSTLHRYATGSRRVNITRAFIIADALGKTMTEMVGR